MPAHPRHRALHLPLLAALALGSSACAPVGSVPPASLAPQPTAVPVLYTHNVFFAQDSAEIPASEAAELRTFLGNLPKGRQLGVSIIGHGDDAANADGRDLPVRRARNVARLAEPYGLGEVDVAVAAEPPAPTGNEAAPVQRRHVAVRVAGYEVRLPACPDWSRRPEGDGRNLPLSNLGCANAVNLGLMVADPADLARGRALSPADGVREAEAVLRYRTDKVKDLGTELLQP
jgi:pilus assembly protein CpaD